MKKGMKECDRKHQDVEVKYFRKILNSIGLIFPSLFLVSKPDNFPDYIPAGKREREREDIKEQRERQRKESKIWSAKNVLKHPLR